MADHWEFVIAAYGLAAVVFGVYWRRLCHKERELNALKSTSRSESTMRSRQPSTTGRA